MSGIWNKIMTDALKKVIETSTFTLLDGRFIYAKVKTAPPIDEHFMVSQDKDEITVVTKEENLSKLDLIEKNKDYWSLISLNLSSPFYCPGFLAAASSAIADKGMDILIVSTYSKDYLLVIYEHREQAEQILLDMGFKRSAILKFPEGLRKPD